VPHLLDTSIAILLRNGEPEDLARLAELDGVLLSVITQVELEGGVHREPGQADLRRARLDAMVRHLSVVPFKPSTAALYGSIVGAAGYSRRRILDRMIAATALELGVTLVTANPADFADVPDLRVLPW
jgi:predicted nucleic acid-binding protein